MHKQRIFGLDVMRAIAITLVLVSHILYIFPNNRNILTGLLQLLGVQGVEIFFVLSGFLIGSIIYDLLLKTSFSFAVIRQFWIRRWLRTLPLYFLILILNLVVYKLIFNQWPEQFEAYFFFLQNFLNEHLLFFPESWSLSVEEFSYLLAPVFMFGFYVLTNNTKTTFLFSSLGLVVVFLVFKVVYYFNHLNIQQDLSYWNMHLKPIVIYRLDTIFYGFLMVYIFKNYQAVFKKKAISLASIGVILFIVLHVIVALTSANFMKAQWFWNVLYLPLNSVAMALCIPYLYQLKTSNHTIEQFVVRISKYSYAMYLTHYTLLLYLCTYFFPVQHLPWFAKVLYALVYVVITYSASSVLYHYFEKPIMNYRDRVFSKNHD